MGFKSYEEKDLKFNDYMDRERFDRQEHRWFSRLGTRSFLLPFNIFHAILNLFFTNYFATLFYNLWYYFFSSNAKIKLISLTNSKESLLDDKGQAVWFAQFDPLNLFHFSQIIISPVLWLIIFGINIFLQIRLSLFLYHRFTRRNVNQLGEARFANFDEIAKLVPLAPDRDYSFPGYGGAPILHLPASRISKELRNQYNIPAGYGAYGYTNPSQHSHKLVIGSSGSAKGQSFVLPEIDLISRAEKKESLLVADTKGENVGKFYRPLRERGYDVLVLDLIEPLDSISYNPLQLAIDYARHKQYDDVQKEINSISFTIYNDESASDKHWQTSAQSLFNALALALLDYCDAHNDFSKATIINVAKMLSSLGAADDPNTNPQQPKKELNTYFERLIEKNEDPNCRHSKLAELAIQEFSISNFAASGEASSIKSTTMVGLEIYNQDKIARMTSKNSFNLGRLGFPRHLDLKVGSEFAFKQAKLEFKTTNGTLIEDFTVPIDETGYISYEIENTLPTTSVLDVNIVGTSYKVSYELYKTKRIDDSGKVVIDKYTGKEELAEYLSYKLLFSNIIRKPEIAVEYKEKPTAVFMVMPSYDNSYNQIISFFISQAYKANVEPATARARGRSVYIPIEVILDEFGNLPEIKEFDTKITVSRSYGITFDLIIQSFKQLNNIYGDNKSAIIRGNCGTWVYIKTDDVGTAEEVIKRLGKKTIAVHSMNGNDFNVKDGHIQENIQSDTLITMEELMNLKQGETIVIASLNRQDTQNNNIVPKPIFNRFDMSMPMAYQLLADTTNPEMTLQEINQNPPHRYLLVSDNVVTAKQFKAFSVDIIKLPADESSLLQAIKTEDIDIEEEADDRYIVPEKLRSIASSKDVFDKPLKSISSIANIKDRFTILESLKAGKIADLKYSDIYSDEIKRQLDYLFNEKEG